MPQADVDYVAVGPRALLAAVEPLLAYRQAHGHAVARLAVEDVAGTGGDARTAKGLTAAIAQIARRAHGRLRFVLLLGDAPALSDDSSGAEFVPVPTFYRFKLDYENHRPDELTHPERCAEDPTECAGVAPDEVYATDLPYTLAGDGATLAVGRVPARTAQEAAAFAQKVIAYEAARPEASWRRRIELFSSPANFGGLADFMIESKMTRALDEEVPYDWDVGVVFPRPGSPYSWPFPDLPQRLVDRLNAGALIAAYVGHGAPTSFDHVVFGKRYYPIATVSDLEAVRAGTSNAFFVSITCNTGWFDLPWGRRSIAETLVLNPEGAIAVLASSRVSHPYPNALYGDALVETFVKGRPRTLGEGITEVKRRMREGEIPLAPLLFGSDPEELKVEHEGLYNLFGDPATVLRYPAEATLALAGNASTAAPGATVTVSLEAGDIAQGEVLLTVETRRSVIRGELAAANALEEMPEQRAWATMRKNHDTAADKVVARETAAVAAGRASFSVKMPAAPGDYILKVLAWGSGEAAMGHREVRVVPPAP